MLGTCNYYPNPDERVSFILNHTFNLSYIVSVSFFIMRLQLTIHQMGSEEPASVIGLICEYIYWITRGVF